MNVLISSAGRRVSLIRAFQRALAERGGSVVACDADPLAPGIQVADIGEILPRLDSPEYTNRLLDLCYRRGIGLVVPTIDTELTLFARLSTEFTQNGITILVSDPPLIDVTIDKKRTEVVFGDAGIRTPKSWLPEELGDTALPAKLFVKPSQGSASANTYPVSSDLVRSILPLVSDPIIQEHIDAPEVTIDALLDLDGTVIHMVPRIRLKTVGGESVQGVTLPDEPIREWLLQVLAVVSEHGGRGPMTLQAFLTPGVPTLVEVNPRFGGGLPLAVASGGDYPLWILQMLDGDVVHPRLGEYSKGMFMTRALDEIFIDGAWST